MNKRIESTEILTPVDTVVSSDYIDILSTVSYYYVVVVTDGMQNSTISNRQFVIYELPHVAEYAIALGILIASSISFVTIVSV